MKHRPVGGAEGVLEVQFLGPCPFQNLFLPLHQLHGVLRRWSEGPGRVLPLPAAPVVTSFCGAVIRGSRPQGLQHGTKSTDAVSQGFGLGGLGILMIEGTRPGSR